MINHPDHYANKSCFADQQHGLGRMRFVSHLGVLHQISKARQIPQSHSRGSRPKSDLNLRTFVM